MNLYDKTEGVPGVRRPVYWDTALRVQENLLGIEAWIKHYEDKLPKHCYIDEAAILAADPWKRGKITAQLREEGWDKFNEAQDLVATNPFGTRYCVEYHFFQHPDKVYRLELMMLTEDNVGLHGFSPLHQALLWSIPPGLYESKETKSAIPHLSFKMAGDSTVKGYTRAVQHLKDQACIHAMTCQSTYGAFGYFIGNDTMRQIYLKPRVNLRDELPIGIVGGRTGVPAQM